MTYFPALHISQITIEFVSFSISAIDLNWSANTVNVKHQQNTHTVKTKPLIITPNTNTERRHINAYSAPLHIDELVQETHNSRALIQYKDDILPV